MPGILAGSAIVAALVLWAASDRQANRPEPVRLPLMATSPQVTSASGNHSVRPHQASDARPAANPDWFAPPPLATDADAPLNSEAVASLRNTRAGDPRAPTIGTSPSREAPDAETLESPARYQDWQQANREARYASYLKAADQRLQEIDQQLAWGKANGVTEASLTEGEEKRQKLQAARDRLAGDYPHLVAARPEPAPWQPPTRAAE